MIKLFNKTNLLPSFITDENSDSAVLFIHGLGGSYWTWDKFSNHLKQHWYEEDSFGLEYDEYYGENTLSKIPFINILIKARKIIKGPSITELAEHLKTVIDEVCHEYENVILIGHSMGGLVARKYIVERLKDKKEMGKVKALITYATPHHGSIYANRYKISLYFLFRFLTFRKSEQVLDLQKNSDFLIQLNSEWSSLRVEDKIDFKRVVGQEDWVVDVLSSSFRLDENAKLVANKNHFSIIKPKKAKDTAFMVTYNYLKEFRTRLQARMELDEAGLDD